MLNGVNSIRLIDPISTELTTDDYIGSASPGSTLELIFSKELGKFDSLKINSELPSGFDTKVRDYLETIKVFITIPKDAINDTYSLNLTLSGKSTEDADIYFIVKNGLLDASLNNYSNQTFVSSPASYTFTLINNSHADDEFYLSALLPWYWLEEKGLAGNALGDHVIKINVPRKSTKEVTLTIYPQTHGEKIFDVVVNLTPKEEKKFSLKVDAKQTFIGKTQNIFYGIPFYSFSLVPSFDLIGLFSLLFN
ncbi:MAG: hypothetical protein HON47_04685 [Candidatus Diapherotrites archaeon]|uniref:Uncharacterized protein n=1 Tax=Candidatus Iainarchaeum sp. TaxID=3101447 RepID=A0A8T5GFT2_9ARCH|nr:hypothetical protein [Candidatus Diapherotrites archaeon]MBT7241380.1 hypothetical protein [Candidatus Diapherotrites archaeon]